MISVLLRPKLLAIRNRWRQQSFTRRHGHDIGLLIFSALMMLGIYRGTLWCLGQLEMLPFLVYVPPYVPLSMILMVLSFMMIISGLASALGSFYFAEDVELLMAMPTPTRGFFGARFIHVLLNASWMPFVFLCPVLLAMGQSVSSGPSFLFFAVFGLIPCFVIPVACASILASLIMVIIDARWTRIFITVGVLLMLAGIVYTANSLATIISSRNDPGQILRMVNSLSSANIRWLPSSWSASLVSELISPRGHSVAIRMILLYASAVCMTSIAYLCFLLLHGWGHTRARGSMKVRSPASALMERSRTKAMSQERAIISKEFHSIFRDISQSTQVMFVAGICLLYLLNIRMFVSIDSIPKHNQFYWKNLFFILHTSITAFFTSSICTRIVFSSVSLEGKQFWLLRIAPLEIRELLRAKLVAWYRPVAVASAILFGVGIFAIEPRWDIVALFVALSLFVTYGIVGLGIGLGAHFADFSWEHPSQLIMSLGSLLYMLASALLILLNILPLVLLLKCTIPQPNAELSEVYLKGTLASMAVITLNYLVGTFAMRFGERSLELGEHG